MSPVKRDKSAVDALVEAIRGDLMTGALGPGQRIDQDGWAERMGVSRTPVRLALERLESEGFVRLLPRRGAVVTEMTTRYVEDVLSTRLVLEASLTRAGVRNLTEEDLGALRAIVQQIEAVDLPEGHAGLVGPTHLFHTRLYEAAEAPIMNRFALQVTDHTHVFLTRFWYANRRIAQVTQRYFSELYDACAARDLDRAERLVRDQRIDLAGVILQDRVRMHELRTLPGVLTEPELERLAAIIDEGREPLGPSPEPAVAGRAPAPLAARRVTSA
jgi:DNA-binding GntR family transcriptional regulator